MEKGEAGYPPKSPMGKGIIYASDQRETLGVFLKDGRILDITSNASERDLRKIVVGRKNWLFFGGEQGRKVNPSLMTIVNTCKEVGVNPLLYLTDVMRQIQFTKASEVETLIPRMWKESEAAKRRIGEERERMQRVMIQMEFEGK